ncbi:MAG: triose-phosphate isomerase [Alphaproteobacteria bacterium]
MAGSAPRKLITGNWKMNNLREEAVALASDLAARVNRAGDSLSCDLALCPPAFVLIPVADSVAGSAIALGAQDCHPAPSGAHTGDISAPMLADAGCAYVIVGHSERRADHGEGDDLVRAKAHACHSAGLVPIICIGETLEERDSGRTLDVVSGQLAGSLPAGATAANIVVAYEPVWAIGTGRVPTTDQVAEVHARIRHDLAGRMDGAEGVRILYGGSVKAENASELLAVANVDGALVGGASLDAASFWGICEACS